MTVTPLFLVPVAAVAAAISAGLIIILLPLLRRYAMARPNARSSHRTPTPQGGGIAVVAATVVSAGAAIVALNLPASWVSLAVILGAIVVIAGVGVLDDMRNLPVLPRLGLQALCVGLVIVALPPDMRLVPALSWSAERALFLLAGVWYVNLVNFMDGLDWLIVAKVVPLAAALCLAGSNGALSPEATVTAAALGGAMLGFAPFNRPVARLFLGDVGSLPIGLLTGWLLLLLAGAGHLTAAILLPLYYCADATITLLRRLFQGESVLSAHRTHFYQRATAAGYNVTQIVSRVFLLNVVLGLLAVLTILDSRPAVHGAALLFGAAGVGLLLWRFNLKQKPARRRSRR